MQKLRQPHSKLNSKKANLQEFLNTYDAVTLQSALTSFESSLGWELLKAYSAHIQRRYEIDALDLVGRHNLNQQAAYASGYAKACEDIQSFMEGLRNTILGVSQVIETPRPEE